MVHKRPFSTHRPPTADNPFALRLFASGQAARAARGANNYVRYIRQKRAPCSPWPAAAPAPASDVFCRLEFCPVCPTKRARTHRGRQPRQYWRRARFAALAGCDAHPGTAGPRSSSEGPSRFAAASRIFPPREGQRVRTGRHCTGERRRRSVARRGLQRTSERRFRGSREGPETSLSLLVCHVLPGRRSLSGISDKKGPVLTAAGSRAQRAVASTDKGHREFLNASQMQCSTK
jgi:hypothetical protein